jgi:hypothetical protein
LHPILTIAIQIEEEVQKSITFCNCEEEAISLTRMGLFPGSPEKPKIAFSILLLEFFEQLLCIAQTPYESFCLALRKIHKKLVRELERHVDFDSLFFVYLSISCIDCFKKRNISAIYGSISAICTCKRRKGKILREPFAKQASVLSSLSPGAYLFISWNISLKNNILCICEQYLDYSKTLSIHLITVYSLCLCHTTFFQTPPVSICLVVYKELTLSIIFSVHNPHFFKISPKRCDYCIKISITSGEITKIMSLDLSGISTVHLQIFSTQAFTYKHLMLTTSEK